MRQRLASSHDLPVVQEHEINVAVRVEFRPAITANRHQRQLRELLLLLLRQAGLGGVPQITQQKVEDGSARLADFQAAGAGPMKHPESVRLYLQKGLVSAQFPTGRLTWRQSQSRRRVSFDFIQQALHATINLCANPGDGKCSKSSPKKRIQTAKYAEYAEKWNTPAYFVYSAVLSPFYFGDVFESSAFCASLSGPATVRRGFGSAWRRQSSPFNPVAAG